MQLKNTFFSIVMVAVLALPTMVSAQSTEGTDFWVTLMRACDDNPTDLYLAFSAQKAANITISNPATGFNRTLSLPNNGHDTIVVKKLDCYVGTADNMKVTNKALHVTSDQPISLVAANYRDKSFDVAAVLPTDALLDDYVICTYPPTVHSDADQGTHFAIVATEDNTIVDYCLSTEIPDTIKTLLEYQSGNVITPEELAYLNAYLANPTIETKSTPVMQAGQVFYYWTGALSGDNADLTGTTVRARDGKKIAVFNGDSHTNIPNAIRDRDHIYSQAMPTAYWGTQFALTSSLTTSDGASGVIERIDKVRVQALEDGTVVVVNGDTLHVFDFTKDKKHYYEFEFGVNAGATSPFPAGTRRLNTTNCFVQTSCPCGVHLYMVSNQYDYPKNHPVTKDKYCNGDPSMIWINPIEQQIEEITFGTFQTAQVQDHFLNIVTGVNNKVMLDGEDKTNEFTVMGGNAKYKFARLKINDGTHTLKVPGGAIAHVYGFGEKESYGFPAGAKTVPLEQAIMINGEKFTADSKNTLCGKDNIHFECDLNYDIKNITWNFGDGSAMVSGPDKTAVDHYYQKTGDYDAYVLIDRESANLCVGQLAHDSIPITVHIGKLEFQVVDTVNTICENHQLKLYYENTGTALTSDNCTYEFNDKAKTEGFTSSSLTMGKDYFQLTIPNGASEGKGYAFTVEIHTGCGDTTVSVGFTVPFDPNTLLIQRWDNVLAVRNSTDYVSFQWFKDGEKMENEVGPVLNLNDVTDFSGAYMVQMRTKDGEIIETCPYTFVHQTVAEPTWGDGSAITFINGKPNEYLFFSTTAEGTAELYGVDGKLLSTTKLNKDGGYVKMGADAGMYIVSIKTDNEKRSMKVFVAE